MAPDDPKPPQPGHGVAVLVELPKHAGLAGALTYRAPSRLPPGQLLRVPLGRRVVCGLAWGDVEIPHDDPVESVPSALRDVAEVLHALPPLDPSWRDLVTFAAAYYQRAPGELALSVLPADLRDPVIAKMDLAGAPILTYTVASGQMDDEALSWFVDNQVTKAMLAVRGVGPSAPATKRGRSLVAYRSAARRARMAARKFTS